MRQVCLVVPNCTLPVSPCNVYERRRTYATQQASAPAFDPRSLRLRKPDAPRQRGGQATNSPFLPKAQATETAALPAPGLCSQAVRGMLLVGAGLSLRQAFGPPRGCATLKRKLPLPLLVCTWSVRDASPGLALPRLRQDLRAASPGLSPQERRDGWSATPPGRCLYAAPETPCPKSASPACGESA
jgi:hypothetical protein